MTRTAWLLALLLAGCKPASAPTLEPTTEQEAAALTEVEAELEAALAESSLPAAELRLLYAQYLSRAPDGPERTRRAIDYAALLLTLEQPEEAIALLGRAVDMQALAPELRARAARVLVDATVARWKATAIGEQRITAAIAVRELATLLLRDDELLRASGPDAVTLRATLASLAVSVGWDIALSHRHIGLANDDRDAFHACTITLLDLYTTHDLDDAPAVLAEAAECSTRAYQIGSAIQIRKELLAAYPGSTQARDANFALAETYQSVLFHRDALEHYRAYALTYPDDVLTPEARTRWLQLAVALGEPLSEVVASWHDPALDEATLAAALEFRTVMQTHDLTAMAEYLAKHREAGGPARELAVRLALAEDALQRSCPEVKPASGLCTSQTVDGRIGEVLRRNRAELHRAELELARARKLLRDADWQRDDVAIAGPPLALEQSELREIEAGVALLLGDLSAEDALSVQPPRTFEPSRTRLWLTERSRSVEAMVSAYARVGSNDPARAAAAAERSAQVYESAATTLGRVALELRERDEPELAAELELLEAERLSQALAAYQQCLAHIAAWGGDPTDVQHACKLGVGRLCGDLRPEPAWTDDRSAHPLMLGAN